MEGSPGTPSGVIAVLSGERSGGRAREKLACDDGRMSGPEDAPAEEAEVRAAQTGRLEKREGSILRREMLWTKRDQEEPWIQQLFCVNRALVTGKGQLLCC